MYEAFLSIIPIYILLSLNYSVVSATIIVVIILLVFYLIYYSHLSKKYIKYLLKSNFEEVEYKRITIIENINDINLNNKLYIYRKIGGEVMKKKLVIVESPSKSRTIEQYLGSEYTVLSSKGHIRDLAISGVGGLGLDIENNFQAKYEVIKDNS